MIRVLIVDDQELVRVGLRTILELTDGIDVVADAADGYEALELCGRHQVDVVLMDVRMPRLDGIETTSMLRQRAHAPAVVLLTTFDLDEYVYAGLRAGASAFLLKDCLAADLLSAIRAVAEGDAVVAPAATKRLIERYVRSGNDLVDATQSAAARSLELLTDRELQILRLLATGLTNSEIAAAAYVSESTVKSHIGRIFAKLSLRDRVHAVIHAYDAGLVQPNEPTTNP
jgi:DNA-binding NarL/FixJ family response regulator